MVDGEIKLISLSTKDPKEIKILKNLGYIKSEGSKTKKNKK